MLTDTAHVDVALTTHSVSTDKIKHKMSTTQNNQKPPHLLEHGVSGLLFSFFLWFRENGELHLGKSIEDMIDIYQTENKMLSFGAKVVCSETEDYTSYWAGTYISKHPTEDLHIICLNARSKLGLEDEIDTFQYCKLQ